MIEDRKYREYYLKTERTAEQQRKDLVIAFDELHELKCKMRGLKLKVWVLSGALLGLCGVSGWLANSLMSCLQAVR